MGRSFTRKARTRNEHNTESKRFQCRHIFTDGTAAAARRSVTKTSATTNTPRAGPLRVIRRTAPARPPQVVLLAPEPQDRSAIQHSIGQILNKLAGNEIAPGRAGLLLYGLQIASLNLKKERKPDTSDPAEPVCETSITPSSACLRHLLNSEATNAKAPCDCFLKDSNGKMRNGTQSPVAPFHPSRPPHIG